MDCSIKIIKTVDYCLVTYMVSQCSVLQCPETDFYLSLQISDFMTKKPVQTGGKKTDLLHNFAKHLLPEDFISLDETLYPMRTQVAFKMYDPDKPAKYGILFKSLNCARYPYTYYSHVFSGKPESSY